MVKCPICNKEWETQRQLGNHIRTHTEYYNEHYGISIFKCIICNKEFEALKARKNVKYCSDECRHKGHKGFVPVNRIEHETRTCICGCSETFTVRINDPRKFKDSSHYKKGFKYSIIKNLGSEDLWKQWCARPGSQNGSWEGGNCSVHPDEFNDELKEIIKTRDGFRCVTCHSEIDLAVHHLDEDKCNNDPRNLITLCRSCHSYVHLGTSDKAKEIRSSLSEFKEVMFNA